MRRGQQACACSSSHPGPRRLSSMRIDERRVPQDGRCTADVGGLKVDLRVSSVPTMWGEKVVMRVLPQAPRHSTA